MEQIKSRRSYHLPICRGMLLLSVLVIDRDMRMMMSLTLCVYVNNNKQNSNNKIANPRQSCSLLYTT